MHFFSKILLDTRKCFKKIFACLKREKYSYTPVHLMRTEIEIETLIDSDEELPQTRFIAPPPSPPNKSRSDILELLDSQDNIVSFDLNNNVKTMTETDMFYSCEEEPASSDEDVFGIDDNFRLDDSDIDFFHNRNVI